MKTRLGKALAAGLLLGLSVGAANATPVLSGSEQSLQSVINGLYQSATCPTCSAVVNAPNVNTDQQAPDQLWAIEASGISAATFVIELAGNSATNSFGMYDAFNGNTVELFGGAADQADQALVSIGANGQVTTVFFKRDSNGNLQSLSSATTGAGYFTGNLFGYYLGTTGGTYYSEASRNAGGADQLVAFKGDGDTIKLPGNAPGQWGSSSYILAWEDMPYANSDKDFNDLVVYVESIKPMPEPGSLALVSVALLGATGAASRRRKNTTA
jgi:Domain of unknown function (DUF4114)